jgi:hypothetical protein
MKRFLISLANAAISGAAVTLTGTTVFHGSPKQVGIAAGVSAGVSAVKWLVQHPLPGGEQDGSQN